MSHRGALIAPGALIGLGLGGFVDGIVFHQILQWHHMLSAVVSTTELVPLKYNMVWDGYFHAGTWLMTAIGVGLLWRAGQRPEVPWSTPMFLGALLLGWGLFNVVEGLIDHHLLAVHHVREGPGQLAWDLGFLAFGAGLLAAGVVLIRRGSRPEHLAPRPGLSAR